MGGEGLQWQVGPGAPVPREGIHGSRQLGPALFPGWVALGPHGAPQVCSSMPSTHHVAFRQLEASACRGVVICYVVAPRLLGSTLGCMVPEFNGVDFHRVNCCTHPSRWARCPRRKVSL